MGYDHDIPHAVRFGVGDQCDSRLGKRRANLAHNHDHRNDGNYDRHHWNGDRQHHEHGGERHSDDSTKRYPCNFAYGADGFLA